MSSAKRKSNDSVTAAVTLPPTVPMTRKSTPKPSAAIDMIVRTLAARCSKNTAVSGIKARERSPANKKNPTMNHGTVSNNLFDPE